MTTTLPNRIIKYFVDTSNPSQSGFYFYEKAGTGGFVRLGALADAGRAGGNTFEIDSSTAENVIYNGLGGADTYVVRSNLDKNIEISDPHTGDDGSGNEVKNTIVFDSDVTVTSINQVTRLEEADILRIELTLDTGAVITVNGPDVFQYVVGGAAALDFAGFIATYGASGITPANRAPVIESDLFASIDENVDGSAVPVSVGLVAASDADAADSLTYSIVSAVDQNGGNVAGFEVDGAGLITYVGTGLDAETITSVVLTVSASDGQESAQTSVAISVVDLNDVAPTITSGATGNALTENATVPNTQVIYTATGTSDVTDISWSLSGPDAGLFNIDRATGEVRFNTETTPDAEAKDSYSFTVVATSGALAAVEQAVAIAVTNIDEGNASFVVTSNRDLNAAVAGDVLTVGLRSSDPDGDGTLTYQWYRDGVDIAGATGASYTITEADGGNSLYVAVRYTDGSGAAETVTASGIIVPGPTATVLNLADLDPTTGFRLDGENRGDYSGTAVSSVGDINNDGYDDFAIGAYAADPNGERSGATYVVFGKASGFSGTIELSELDGSDGFRIDGESAYDLSGRSISAGDVNDDGYNDIIIGADGADPNGERSGATYVVFGKSSGFSETIDLSDIVRIGGGVRIDGENTGDWSGRSVSSGDVNDDGYDDIIIGAGGADSNGASNNGSTYVVFGKADGLNGLNGIMELSELDGSDGFRIDSVNRVNYHSERSLSAGDINGDGYDDVIIGSPFAAPNGIKSGSTYVVFGKASGFSRTMELSELDGSDGFRIDGESSYNRSGKYVSSAGDIDGDGYDDIIIGASGADSNGASNNGATYVVFGKESGFSRVIELSELDGSDGFRINGENTGDYSGHSVSSAGDFNGDGYDDLIIGAPFADPNETWSGSSYVVFGKESGFSRTIELSELDGSDSFRIDGESAGDLSGFSVSSAGDVNDDGYDDIIIGARQDWGWGAGHSYIIYGHATPANRAPVIENVPTDLSIDENADGSAVPVSVGRVVASDADAADTLTYSIISAVNQNGDSVTGFEVDGAGLITYVGTGLNAETITSVALTVSASDGQESAQTSVAISVTNIDEGNASFVVTSDGDITAAVAGDVLTVGLRSSDPDGDGTLTYQWYRDGVDIAGATGASYTITEADGGNSLYVAVRYTDGSGTDETVTASGIIVSAPVDNTDRNTPATPPAILNLADLTPTTGFRLDGEMAYDFSGRAVSSAGDVNGDGYDDIIIGSPFADPNGEGSGASYVVFGKASGFSRTIELSELDGSDGFRLDGSSAHHLSGYSVSSAGDVNGDGYDDIIIGAHYASQGGASYVVFGKESSFSRAIELSELDGSDGFRIGGENRGDKSGYSVSSAGDVNGDGYDDIIIGAVGADPNGTSSGSSYIVFGKEGNFGRTIELSELDGRGGFRIDGENAYDKSGYSVSSAGDINGDGYDDIIIGAHYVDRYGDTISASSYVVFGKESDFNRTIELSELDGRDGFRIDGENTDDNVGKSVSSAGDINGDGYDDIIIGAWGADPNGRSGSGSSYVVFGKESSFSRAIELSELDGSDGFRIDGWSHYLSGYSVSSAGDVNGDGYDDVIIGAHNASLSGGRQSGASYVVFGKASGFNATINLSASSGGIRIDGANVGDWSGYSVSSAGDVNGDGYDDVIIGAALADPNGRDSGANYVVFGYATSDADEDADTVIPAPAPANRVPVFENAPTDLSIDENADGSAVPVSVGQVAASDADAADTLTYSIISTADQNGDSVTGFEVDGAGLITYVGTGLDAETITSVALTVSASDGQESAQTSVAISVTNIDEGNASFVVTSDRDINAAVAGDVLTVGLISSDPDGDGTFTYQWYRDGVDIAGATGASYTIPEDYDGNSIYVVVRYTDGSGTDETVTASGIIVPVLADNDDDASEDPVNTTYTMTQAPTGVSLTRGGVALSVGETFTHQDIQGGSVALTVNDENALSGLRLTTDDGTDANPAEISLDIEVREVADIAAPEAGNDLDYSENEGSLVIDTGDYGDQITAAQGSDFITGGLGDDTINLDSGDGGGSGQDTVVYNFGSGSIFTATDGGDDITGFKRGEDIFLLKTESDNPELATLDGLFSYVSGPNKGSSHDDLMIVRPNYEYEPDGSGGLNFFLTGIEFHFEDGGVYGNGYLAQGHVSITFDERLPWEEFLSLIEIDNGNGSIDGNFDHRRGIIRDLSTLPNLMGEGSLAYEVEAPAQTPPQDVDVPLEDDIPATSFDVV